MELGIIGHNNGIFKLVKHAKNLEINVSILTNKEPLLGFYPNIKLIVEPLTTKNILAFSKDKDFVYIGDRLCTDLDLIRSISLCTKVFPSYDLLKLLKDKKIFDYVLRDHQISNSYQFKQNFG